MNSFNPCFDFFQFWNLSRHLHYSINDQGWGHQDAIVRDGFDVLHFDNVGLNAQFFHCVLGSLRELIALRSTHTKNFDLFHCFYLLCPLLSLLRAMLAASELLRHASLQ